MCPTQLQTGVAGLLLTGLLRQRVTISTVCTIRSSARETVSMSPVMPGKECNRRFSITLAADKDTTHC